MSSRSPHPWNRTLCTSLLLCFPTLPLHAELARKAVAGVTLGVANGELAIAGVAANGNAARDGLQAGDVILRVDGVPAKPEGEFARSISKRNDGDRIEWVVRRDAREVRIPIEYRAAPQETAEGLEVLYRTVESDGHLRRALITLPKSASAITRLPAVLWIAGSGCGSQEAPGSEPSTLQFLYELSRRGYVTMRVEKTGVGDSEGPPCYSEAGGMTQEVHGYVAGLEALRSYDFVDPAKIFVFGHSAGATLAPLVAHRQAVRGIVVAGAMGTNFLDYLLAMKRRELELAGNKPEEIAASMAINTRCITRLLRDRRSPGQVEQEMPDCQHRVRYDSPPSYIQEWAGLKLEQVWKEASPSSVLVLHGSADFVTSQDESRALVRTIHRVHSGRVRFRILPMDHEFQTFASQKDAWTAEQRDAKGTLYPGLVGVLDAFFRSISAN